MKTVLDRLRERKVVQWTVAYAAFAWFSLQLIEVLGGILGIANWVQRGAVIVLAFGFLVTAVLAWFHGERGRQRVGGLELVILAVILAAGGAALTLVRPDGAEDAQTVSATGPRLGPNSIAVLPFLDLSADQSQEYLSDGVAAELLSAIDRIPDLNVPSLTASFAYKDSPLTQSEIARELGVAMLVEGRVGMDGDDLRINASIVRAGDGQSVWEHRFEARAENIFAIQDTIARAVAEALEVRLTGEADELRLRGQTDDHVALDLYLRGRYEWMRRTQPSLEAAVEAFQAALARDPNYARALIGLGDAYAIMGFYDYRPPAEAFPAAQEAARQALSIDASLAAPHATLGYAALYYDWDWDMAAREFEIALELDPSYATGHQWDANYYVAMGRFERAGEGMRRASDLDPRSAIAHTATAFVYWYEGEGQRAVLQLDQTLSQWPDYELALLWRGQALASLGQLDEAVAMIEQALEVSNDGALVRAALAHALGQRGQRDQALGILSELEAEAAERYVPPYEIARAYVGLGELDTAVEWLERAHEARAHSMAFLAVDPVLIPLEGHPGYEALIDRMNLRDVAERVSFDRY